MEAQPVFVAFEFFKNRFGPLWIIPETGVHGLLFFIFDLHAPVTDVKDTSLKQPGGPASFSTDLQSYLLSWFGAMPGTAHSIKKRDGSTLSFRHGAAALNSINSLLYFAQLYVEHEFCPTWNCRRRTCLTVAQL